MTDAAGRSYSGQRRDALEKRLELSPDPGSPFRPTRLCIEQFDRDPILRLESKIHLQNLQKASAEKAGARSRSQRRRRGPDPSRGIAQTFIRPAVSWGLATGAYGVYQIGDV